jgi:hypothetical protein
VIKKYRKKPVEIEAVRFRNDNKTITEICKWLKDDVEMTFIDENAVLHIKTLEGKMEAKPGDYIIKGIKGEFYPCKPDIFEATYEEVV